MERLFFDACYNGELELISGFLKLNICLLYSRCKYNNLTPFDYAHYANKEHVKKYLLDIHYYLLDVLEKDHVFIKKN